MIMNNWQKGALKPEKIQILDFRIINGLIDTPLDFDESLMTGFSSDVNFEMSFNLDDKLIKADFQVKVNSQSNRGQLEESTGSFHFVFIYHVENLNVLTRLLGKNKTKLDIHPDLSNAIASVTYSTARGILMTRFQGTSLEGFILPVINPNTIL